MDNFQPVVFKLGQEKYGLNIEYVNAIERFQTVVRVPNASSSIKGVINLRGEVIPVVDLKSKFNFTDRSSASNAEYVIVNLPDSKLALEVDGVDEIHSIEMTDMVDVPVIAKGAGVDYFEHIAKIGNELVIMINPFKLLSESERASVEQLVKDTEE